MSISKCVRCGGELDNGANFCKYCGAKTALANATVSKDTHFANPTLSTPTQTVQMTNNVVKAEPGIIRLSFGSIQEANVFLRSHNNIKDISADFITRTRYGLFANHGVVQSINITAIAVENVFSQVYQLGEHEYTNFFLQDRSDMRAKLQQLNPHVRIVSTQGNTYSRGRQGLTTALGIGVHSHRQVYVTYLQGINDFSPLNF